MTDTPQGTRLVPVDQGRGFPIGTGALHPFVFGAYQARRLEVEDVHFHFDSAVMMPDHGPAAAADDANHVSGLAVIRAALLHAQRHETEELLVAGHTDRSGSADYNRRLSAERADNVLQLLTGDRAGWAKGSAAHHQAEDVQQILTWVAATFGWDCDPGGIDNDFGADSKDALSRFKTRYNEEFEPAIPVTTSTKDEATWRAFYDCYQRGLEKLLGADAAAVATLRAGVRFLASGPRTVGCGESHPITASTTLTSQIDRRVELLFFDGNERPRLDCHPGSQCLPEHCELYGPRAIFTIDPLPTDDWSSLGVHLRLAWTDPTGAVRAFPAGLSVIVELGDAAEETTRVTTGDDGRLTFVMDRRKGSFSLRFESDHRRYVASPPPGSPEAETLLFEPEVAGAVDEGKRVWLLPRSWSLQTSDWNGPTGGDATTATFSDHRFRGLDRPTTTVGRAAAPITLTLDPHWQFLKWLYFDRRLKAKLSLPPCVVDALRAGSTEPIARSNWLTPVEASQCLPWLERRTAAGATLDLPKADTVIRLRTLPGTFVEVLADGTRRLVSLHARNPNAPTTRAKEPERNGGVLVDLDLGKPVPGRLRFYDLPEEWHSTGYWTAQVDSAGGPTRRGLYADLATRPTDDAHPLMFSLDDVVLVDHTGTPVPFAPGDRVAVFAHTFAAGPNLSDIGLYRPDAGTTTSPKEIYLTEPVPRLADGINYLAEYPDWTRLICFKGNLFDVFDQRIRDGGAAPVGARAAVRWRDVTTIGKVDDPVVSPGTTVTPFFSLKPYFSQEHAFPIGRFDLACLRCCDVEGTGADAAEVAVFLQYHRYFFRFNTPKADLTDRQKKSPVSVATGAKAQAFINRCCVNVGRRWTNFEASLGGTVWNPGRALVLPEDAKVPVRGEVITLLQHLPKTESSFEIRVFGDIRASMNSRTGIGQISDGTGPPMAAGSSPSDNSLSTGFFTMAHEVGHGQSLPDEYIEQTVPFSKLALVGGLAKPSLPGFDSFFPGAPFVDDGAGMMRGNAQVRARYFWHVAEWFRTEVDPAHHRYLIQHDVHRYRLPSPLAPIGTRARARASHPLAIHRGLEIGHRGHADVYLYPMGEDGFTQHVLPARIAAAGPTGLGLIPPGFVDGLLLIEVRLRARFADTDDVNVAAGALDGLQARVYRRFQHRFVVRGTAAKVTFRNCLIHFSIRFLVPGHSDDSPTLDRHFRIVARADHATAWDSGVLAAKRTLHWRRTKPGEMLAPFANMIGIDDGKIDDAPSYRALVEPVFPGGSIVRL